MTDRAALVTRAVLELIIAEMRTEEFRQQLEEMLRDEFAEEHSQGVADRSLDPNA